MRYFSHKLDKGFIALFSSQAIRRTALSLLSVFLPIFLYVLFDGNIFLVIAYFAISAVFYGGLLPLAARALNKIGFRRALIFGSLFGMLNFGLLAVATAQNAFFVIPLALIILTVFKLLYWIPYHVDFARFTKREDRGRNVSMIFAMISFAGIVGPIAAGYIIQEASYVFLFSVTIALYGLSILPLFHLPKVMESYKWGYAGTWRRLLAPQFRKPLIAIGARGAENVIALTIWPIFVFILLDGDVLNVGALSTFTFGAVVILQLALGRFIDTSEKKRYETLHVGSVLYAIGWILKIFVVTSFQIFIAGFYHGIARIFTRTPFDTLVYDFTADQGHYVDEYTVLKEMAIQAGKVMGLAIIAVLLVFLPLKWVFVVAAGASLLLNILYYKKEDPRLLAEHKSVPSYQLHR